MATIIHDGFDGSGGIIGRSPDIVDNGQTWQLSTNDTGLDYTIGSSRAYVNSTVGSGDLSSSHPAFIECGTANVQITAQVYTKSGDGGYRRDAGAVIRCTDEGDHIKVVVTASEDMFRIVKYEGDVGTELDTLDVSPLADGTYTIVATAQGDNISASLYSGYGTGGTLLGTLSTTSSYQNTATTHGIFLSGRASANAYVWDVLIAEAGAPQTLTGWTVAANGVTVTATLNQMDYSAISGFESGKGASITSQGVSIPLSFASIADAGGGNCTVTFTAASPALTGETVTADADAGLFDDGVDTSLVATSEGVTNSSTQTAETLIEIASMALLDSDTIRLTITTDAVAWGNTVTTDTADVSVWAVRGYGHPTVATISTSGEGTQTLYVDLNLSRSVYSDEWMDIETRTGWLSDDRGNTAVVRWSLAGQVRLDCTTGATPPATATTISSGRTSLTLSAGKAVSWYLDGVPAIVVPTGTVDINSETPARTTATGGEAINGAMLNMLVAGTQAFDERVATYSSGSLPALSCTVDDGDCYVKAYCVDDADAESLDGASAAHPSNVMSYGVYHFVASAPAANEVAPPAIGYAGTGRPTATMDLDAVYAALPAKSISSVGTSPDLYQWISRFCQSNIGGYLSRSGNNRPMVPIYYTTAEGYGQDQSKTVANVLIHLMGDEATEAQKKFLARWVCHHGLQMWYSSQANRLYGDGGNNQGFGGMMVAALYWTGNTSDIQTLRDEGHGNEFAQTFAWDQDHIDRYNNTHTDATGSLASTKSYMRYQHTIAAGGVSGNVITLTTGLSNKYFESVFEGLRITNGTQTAIITTHTRYDEFFTVDDATGFAAGQTVTLEGYDTLPAIGTPNWGITHKADPSRTWFQAEQSYQDLNDWSMAVMFVQFLGNGTGLANDPWIREAVEVNADQSYLGSFTGNSPKRHESTLAGDFWNAYEADAALTGAGGFDLSWSPVRNGALGVMPLRGYPL